MIRPRVFPGVAFGEIGDGDPRSDAVARAAMADSLGVSHDWAVVDQVHGTRTVLASGPGNLGEADGIYTRIPMLPIAIATADCVPVVIVGSESLGIVHAGWRGLAAGIVSRAVGTIEDEGDRVRRAVIGPHIGPCCYEVGPDVVDAIGGYGEQTTTGAPSVALGAAIRDQLAGVDVTDLGLCTMHDERFHSYRENATPQRQVTVAWIPQG
jgi:YfiH family protein